MLVSNALHRDATAAVLVEGSVADPGSPNIFHPGSRVKKIPGSASASASNNLSILTQKNEF
jgi:hypothetical protein